MPLSALQQLGYPRNHGRIYLTMLKMGEATISDIVSRLHLPRTTVAESVEEMHGNGLLHFYKKRGRKYWVAEDPKKLTVMLEERRAALDQVIPTLLAMHERGTEKSKFRVYEGAAKIKNIFFDIIKHKKPVTAIGAIEDVLESFGLESADQMARRFNKHFIKVRLLTKASAMFEKFVQGNAPTLHQARFLPADVPVSKILHVTYDTKAVIMCLGPKDPFAIVIEDPHTAQMMAFYFETLWEYCAGNSKNS